MGWQAVTALDAILSILQSVPRPSSAVVIRDDGTFELLSIPQHCRCVPGQSCPSLPGVWDWPRTY